MIFILTNFVLCKRFFSLKYDVKFISKLFFSFSSQLPFSGLLLPACQASATSSWTTRLTPGWTTSMPMLRILLQTWMNSFFSPSSPDSWTIVPRDYFRYLSYSGRSILTHRQFRKFPWVPDFQDPKTFIICCKIVA